MFLTKNKILFLFALILLFSCSHNKEKQINELGEIPILMYHQIIDIGDNAAYYEGNVDKDGYQRSAKAFREDLEFYYANGYRMIRLNDYIDGKINCEKGKSPLIITFDDGVSNIKIKEETEDGQMIIDENCAIGILEEFKTKYPDFNVTATFFLHGGLFNLGEQNQKAMKWVVDHGYDIGNHTIGHNNLSDGGKIFAQRKVAEMYDLLEKMIGDKFVNIVALPYGVPVIFNHHTNQALYEFTENEKTYHTKSLIKSLYLPEKSPFHKEANVKFLERIFAVDSEKPDDGIKNIFAKLEKVRYISDGDENTITIKKSDAKLLGKTYNLKVLYN